VLPDRHKRTVHSSMHSVEERAVAKERSGGAASGPAMPRRARRGCPTTTRRLVEPEAVQLSTTHRYISQIEIEMAPRAHCRMIPDPQTTKRFKYHTHKFRTNRTWWPMHLRNADTLPGSIALPRKSPQCLFQFLAQLHDYLGIAYLHSDPLVWQHECSVHKYFAP